MSWFPAPHFWFTGSAFFTLGSFALFAILGFAGVASMTAAYRNWMIFGYMAALALFFIGWWQAARQEEASAKRDVDFASIQLVLNKIASSANVSLNQSATEIASAVIKKIEPLQKQVDRLTNPPRDPDGLYQLGRLVGNVSAAIENRALGQVQFGKIAVQESFNAKVPFDYRDLQLRIVKTGSSAGGGVPGSMILNVFDVTAEIIGTR
jgi:hypothetical protein